MTTEQRELFRTALLRILDENRTRFGMNSTALRLRLDLRAGIKASDAEVLDEIDYLQSRTPPLVEEVLKQVSPENRAWRITADGIAFVDSH